MSVTSPEERGEGRFGPRLRLDGLHSHDHVQAAVAGEAGRAGFHFSCLPIVAAHHDVHCDALPARQGPKV